MTKPFDLKQCPKCSSTDTVSRHGVYFDHMRRCCTCGHCWDSDNEIDRYHRSEIERLDLNTHRE